MKLPLKYLLLPIALVLIQQVCFAQKLLLQENPKTGRRTHYKVTDGVELKLRHHEGKYIGEITQINDSNIVVNGRTMLKLTDISFIKPLDKHYLLYVASTALVDAGIFYPVIDIANRAINKQYPIPPGTAYISGSLLGSGLLIKFFINRYYHITGHRRLRVIDVTIEPIKE